MILETFSVHDAMAKAWLQPFYARTVDEARRMMCDTCADPNSLFSKHPKDFRLYHVGHWDDHKGQFVLKDIADLICSAEDCMPGPLFDERPRSVRPALVGEAPR
jgi:hypothetical protein